MYKIALCFAHSFIFPHRIYSLFKQQLKSFSNVNVSTMTITYLNCDFGGEEGSSVFIPICLILYPKQMEQWLSASDVTVLEYRILSSRNQTLAVNTFQKDYKQHPECNKSFLFPTLAGFKPARHCQWFPPFLSIL